MRKHICKLFYWLGLKGMAQRISPSIVYALDADKIVKGFSIGLSNQSSTMSEKEKLSIAQFVFGRHRR